MDKLKTYLERELNLKKFNQSSLRDGFHRSYFNSNAKNMEKVLSSETLKDIQAKHGKINFARDEPDNVNFYKLEPHSQEFANNTHNFACEYLTEWRQKRVSGFFYYPKGAYMGWHTNYKTQGNRLYLVHADEDRKSFFRYQDQETKEVVTLWDKKGWNLYQFNISEANPYWHCVGSMCNRVSLGICFHN